MPRLADDLIHDISHVEEGYGGAETNSWKWVRRMPRLADGLVHDIGRLEKVIGGGLEGASALTVQSQ